jgi:beta-lactamase class A
MHRQQPDFRHSYYGPKRKTKPRRTFKKFLVTAKVIALLILIIFIARSFLSLQSKIKSVSASPKVAAKAPAAINQTLMTSQINQVISGSNLEIGVSVIDITTGVRYDYGLGDTQYIAASTTKLLSAALFLHDVEQGQASLNQPLGGSTAQTEMRKMITISDDNAWLDFNTLLGHPALNAYAQSLGMNSYDPDNNTITPDDLAVFLARLYQGKLLNSQHTSLLLGYMSNADYPQYIGGVIPSGVKFYHKIGYLNDRIMDAAIIDNGKRPYVLVIFTKNPSGAAYYNQSTGRQVFHTITTTTLNTFSS